jgi:uncharacterized membrane protein YjdF
MIKMIVPFLCAGLVYKECGYMILSPVMLLSCSVRYYLDGSLYFYLVWCVLMAVHCSYVFVDVPQSPFKSFPIQHLHLTLHNLDM